MVFLDKEDTMEFINESNRIIVKDENHRMVAAVTFPNVTENTVNIEHTFVDPSLRGQGIAGKLMLEMVKQLRTTNKMANPVCDFATFWFKKNPEHQDVLMKKGD